MIWEKNIYTAILGPKYTFINFRAFPSKPDFHLHRYMRKNSFYTTLLRPKCLVISEKSATYTIKWSYTIIWQVRVQFFVHLFRYNFYFDVLLNANQMSTLPFHCILISHSLLVFKTFAFHMAVWKRALILN